MFGRRKDEVFKKLKELLEPFNIKKYYTDDWGAYERHIEKKKHEVGKRNTQKIERKNLNLRTWIILVRLFASLSLKCFMILLLVY